jgi:hypothetical protein
MPFCMTCADTHYFAAHPDLVYDERLLAGTDALGEHAVLVAGVIGATHGNGGIDGISPFARLVVGARSDGMGAVSMTVTDLPTWVRSFVRVLNTSWGQDYLERKSPMEAPDAAALADEHGRAVRDFRLRIEARGPASTNNALLGSNEMTVQITPGSDQLMNLRCLEMYVQVTTTPGALGPHEFGEVKVSAQLRDPAAATATPVVGASVEFSNITGGGILQDGGVTGPTGEYYNVATLSAGSSGMTFVVNVVSNDGRRAVLNVSIPLREGASW